MKWLILTEKNEFWQDRAVSAFIDAAEKSGAECDVLPCISFDKNGTKDKLTANVDAVIAINEHELHAPISGVCEYAVSLYAGTVKSGKKILCEGIPIPESADCRLDKTAARNFLVVPKEQKIILVSTSGMTTESCLSLCDVLSRSDDVVLWLFTDRECELKYALSKVYDSEDKVQLITYTEKIDVYIKAADVMISRGGVPAAEAIASGIPLVLFPFDDKYDNDLIKSESAVAAMSAENASSKAFRLLRSSALRERMTNMQRKHANHNAAENTVRCIIRDMEINKTKGNDRYAKELH